MVNRVSHFDILADNPKRVAEFYKKVFGWKFDKWESDEMDYWMIMTGKGKGIDGGMSLRNAQSAMGPATTIEVKDLDSTLEKIIDKGGQVVMPKGAITGVGWFAVFKDTEGNVFGLMENDKKANTNKSIM